MFKLQLLNIYKAPKDSQTDPISDIFTTIFCCFLFVIIVERIQILI